MLHDGCVIVDIHIGEGVGSAVGTQQQRVAGTVVAGVVCIAGSAHQSAVGVLAVSGRDTLGDDGALGVLAHVYHLGTGVGLLIVVGDGN